MRTLIALSLILFTTGCATTEPVVQYRTTVALPPDYLCVAEPLPKIPAGLVGADRNKALLKVFAARGDVIKRSLIREDQFTNWKRRMREIYPDSVEQPLEDTEESPSAPKSRGSR